MKTTVIALLVVLAAGLLVYFNWNTIESWLPEAEKPVPVEALKVGAASITRVAEILPQRVSIREMVVGPTGDNPTPWLNRPLWARCFYWRIYGGEVQRQLAYGDGTVSDWETFNARTRKYHNNKKLITGVRFKNLGEEAVCMAMVYDCSHVY